MGKHFERIDGYQRQLPANHVDDGRRTATIWNVLQLDTGRIGEQFKSQVRSRAIAGRGKADLARLFLGLRDEILQ